MPAPQGIGTTNGGGQVPACAMSFDDDDSILKSLDHVQDRYATDSDDARSVVAERFMKFPSHKLPDVADNGRRLQIARRHPDGQRCLAEPDVAPGTPVGKIIGRALDEHGDPLADTSRQEHDMDARLEIGPELQQEFARAVETADSKQLTIPDEFAGALIGPTHLGQLDVNPLGTFFGSGNAQYPDHLQSNQSPSC